ncbi:hypothetical protein CEXT_584431 [Caerostris extrusa]|uniref:Uncharacterized protein n=1 Tax=Caerostris extrusa TaxID=172846 RepID=A0AAV4XQM5_CAEEX|nr:hypothetical protein CEXT_584431 [Caerostris extrusa]
MKKKKRTEEILKAIKQGTNNMHVEKQRDGFWGGFCSLLNTRQMTTHCLQDATKTGVGRHIRCRRSHVDRGGVEERLRVQGRHPKIGNGQDKNEHNLPSLN